MTHTKLAILAAGMVSSLAIAGAATAADAPATTSWTGGYYGVNLGAAYANGTEAKTTGTPAYQSLGSTLVPSTLKTEGNGFIGGVQAGYNVQSGNVVYGVEARFDGADVKRTGSFTSTDTVLGTTLTTSARTQLASLGDLRGRIGYAGFDKTLLYVSGGLAFGQVKTAASVIPNALASSGAIWSGSNSTFRTGYTLGLGGEYKVNPRVSLVLDYSYFDLGKQTTAALGNSVIRSVSALDGVDYYNSTRARGDQIRVGLNIRFGQ